MKMTTILKKWWFWTIALLFIIILGSIEGNGGDVVEDKIQGTQVVENSLVEAVEVEEEAEGTAGGTTEIITDTKVFYNVIKVIDGDTLSIDLGGENTTLRLIGIDTPETVDPRRVVECFGKEASEKAKELLSGKRVRIEQDLTQGELDKYGRLLAYVYLEDGTFFNEHMIKEGYAYEYTYNTPYKYQQEFKEAERQAQAQEKGLWAGGVCENFEPYTEVQEETSPEIENIDTSQYTCEYNAYNCSDFLTHNEAQAVYLKCGGASNDINRLDGDKDGSACESLP